MRIRSFGGGGMIFPRVRVTGMNARSVCVTPSPCGALCDALVNPREIVEVVGAGHHRMNAGGVFTVGGGSDHPGPHRLSLHRPASSPHWGLGVGGRGVQLKGAGGVLVSQAAKNPPPQKRHPLRGKRSESFLLYDRGDMRPKLARLVSKRYEKFARSRFPNVNRLSCRPASEGTWYRQHYSTRGGCRSTAGGGQVRKQMM